MKFRISERQLNSWMRDKEYFNSDDFHQFLSDNAVNCSYQHSRAILAHLEIQAKIVAISPEGLARQSIANVESWKWAKSTNAPEQDFKNCGKAFSPKSATISKTEIQKRQKWRKEQKNFRTELLKRGCCQISKCNVEEILEAAHVKPFAEGGISQPENGLLLRADLHSLFDRDHLAINPTSFKVEFSKAFKLKNKAFQDYKKFDGEYLKQPIPNTDYLKERYNAFLNHQTNDPIKNDL